MTAAFFTLMFAEVIIPKIPVSPFTYKIPERLSGWIEVGMRVEVPVRKKTFTGVVINVQKKSERKRFSDIASFKDPIPLLKKELIELYQWLSEYYICGLPECYQAVIPSKLFTLPESYVCSGNYASSKEPLNSRDMPDRILSISEIAEFKDKITSGHLELLYKRYKYLQSDLVTKNNQSYNQPFIPTGEQQQAIEGVKTCIEKGIPANFLLYGITGSGKTLVYMELAKYVMDNEKSVLMLVPEISLTPVMEQRFEEVFGNRVVVLHSRLTAAERFKRWEMTRRGFYDIVIGPRSAVFIPIKSPGLIIVDEEQDTSYKQETPQPRYNARDVAIMRGRIESIPVLLGSATPSIESYHNASTGKYRLLTLTERPGGSKLPNVVTVNMAEEHSVGSSLSATVVSRMNTVLAGEKQVLLLLNRRGYARFVRCPDCGKMWRCPDCEINYTLHTQSKKLICHYCGKTETPPTVCPKCESSSISLFGTGTQRLEKSLNELFPEATVSRMDLDSTLSKGQLETIIEEVTGGKVNILIGTQMVGKGFDFPYIQLTGILSTDLGLAFPDFRAREATFRLLTQAAGRAGRRKTPGEVYIQTFMPDEYSIYHASNQDFQGFYNEEIRSRRKLLYPPYVKLALCTLSASDSNRAASAASLLMRKMQILKSEYSGKLFRILGPAPAPLYKIKNLYRYQVLLKLDSIIKFNRVLIRKYPDAPMGIIPRNVRLSMNIDPQDMM